MSLHSTPALAPLGALYGAVVRARLALYRTGILPTHKLDAPVLSVGNITTGGTGKTPLVDALARLVAGEGRRVCILTRGYGRADARRRVVVSDGVQLLASAREGGDEPRLLAEQLLGVAAVISDADRVAAARWAQANLHSDAFILDDGFQHLRLARDLDIVTIDATAPWGGGYLLPRGHLREPPEELRRADAVVITRAEAAVNLASLRQELAQLCGGRLVVSEARVRTVRVRRLDNAAGESQSRTSTEGESPELIAQPVAAVCAIGNPQAFFTHLRRNHYTLSYTRAFPDHHAYTQDEMNAVARAAGECGARALLTTAKDGVKLRGLHSALPVYVIDIKMEFDDESVWLGMVRAALQCNASLKRPA